MVKKKKIILLIGIIWFLCDVLMLILLQNKAPLLSGFLQVPYAILGLKWFDK